MDFITPLIDESQIAKHVFVILDDLLDSGPGATVFSKSQAEQKLLQLFPILAPHKANISATYTPHKFSLRELLSSNTTPRDLARYVTSKESKKSDCIPPVYAGAKAPTENISMKGGDHEQG